MDKEQVIALARESGLHRNDHTSEQRIEAAERFAALVAAAEREACAMVAEQRSEPGTAAFIRARGQI